MSNASLHVICGGCGSIASTGCMRMRLYENLEFDASDPDSGPEFSATITCQVCGSMFELEDFFEMESK